MIPAGSASADVVVSGAAHNRLIATRNGACATVSVRAVT
jgi:hypothetical protein